MVRGDGRPGRGRGLEDSFLQTKVDNDVMMLLLMSIVKDFGHGGREVGKYGMYPHEFSAYRDKNTPDDGQYI